MKSIDTILKCAEIIELDQIEGERGFFSRTFCSDEFARYSLNTQCAQFNTTYNRYKGILRGRPFKSLFRSISTMEPQPLLVDGRRMIDKNSIAQYEGIGL